MRHNLIQWLIDMIVKVCMYTLTILAALIGDKNIQNKLDELSDELVRNNSRG